VTLARIIQTGSGRMRARLSIAGFAGDFVTHRRMKQTLADGRVWIESLDVKSLKWGARTDLLHASLEAEGFTATLKDHRQEVTRILAKRPTLTTRLMQSVTDTDVVLNVEDTSGFPAAAAPAADRVIHVNTEAIRYTNKTATTFTGCVRGVWGTTPQYHYTTDGAALAYPPVTNAPKSLEGRAVSLSLYGDGDSGTGLGTAVFRGMTNRGFRYVDGVYTLGIDPVTRVLDQNIGGDLNEPTPIRGIRYTRESPFILVIAQDITSGTSAVVTIIGFFEDQGAFCVELSTQIANATAAWGWAPGSSIVAMPEDGGWYLEYTIGAAGTPFGIRLDTTRVHRLSRNVGRSTSSALDVQLSPNWISADGTTTAPPYTLGATYQIHWSAPVPRGVVGHLAVASTVTVGAAPGGEDFRIYLGGTLVPTLNMALFIEGGEGDPTPATIVGCDTTDRWVDVETPFRILGPDTKLTFGRLLERGGIYQLRNALVNLSPSLCNAGGMPLITGDDLLPSADTVIASYANPALGLGRTWIGFEAFTLADLIEPELRAIACYPRIGAGGAIEWKQLRASVATDTVQWTIGERDLLRGTRPTTERGQYGLLGVVVYKTGWVAKENEHLGPTFKFRDMGAVAPNRVSQTLEIAQLSLERGATDPRSGAVISIEDVRRAAMPVLGLFGDEYDVIQVVVGMRYFSVLVGDTVALTSSKVPQIDGTMGVVDDLCFVTATGFDMSTGSITLQLLRHGQRIRGYAPAFRMDPGNAALVAGTTYDITVNIADYTDRASVGDWLEAGDLVAVQEQDSAAPSAYVATVVSIPSATVVRLLFVVPFVFGAAEWNVGTRSSFVYDETDNLGRFMFQAGVDRRFAFASGTVDAMVFAP
jgi:hypothetical protein